jgi:hypothetical protein
MKYRFILVVAIAATVLMTAMAALAVDKKGTIEELKERFENSHGKDRVELGVVIAQRQIDAAEKAYNAGDTDTGQRDVVDVAQYGIAAANEAVSTGKRMKDTEIDLRKVSERLDNLARSVDIDARPPVQEAQKRLEAARNNLLTRMFK